MIEKDIILFEGEEYEVNITAILNTIIAFVMDILNFEFPEAGDILD